MFFFFNDTATTEIYTLSLHDALPIALLVGIYNFVDFGTSSANSPSPASTSAGKDRKSTRLNSSHTVISYAVFCLKKKKMRVYILAVCKMVFTICLASPDSLHILLTLD